MIINRKDFKNVPNFHRILKTIYVFLTYISKEVLRFAIFFSIYSFSVKKRNYRPIFPQFPLFFLTLSSEKPCNFEFSHWPFGCCRFKGGPVLLKSIDALGFLSKRVEDLSDFVETKKNEGSGIACCRETDSRLGSHLLVCKT